jgi:hypothetical protein
MLMSPRLLRRKESPLSRQESIDEETRERKGRTPVEALPVNGVDVTAARRAFIRALNTQRQQNERGEKAR